MPATTVEIMNDAKCITIDIDLHFPLLFQANFEVKNLLLCLCLADKSLATVFLCISGQSQHGHHSVPSLQDLHMSSQFTFLL